MDLESFFLTEDFTATHDDTPAGPDTPDRPEQLALLDACAYRGPRNRRGVHNTAAIDPLGNIAV